MKNVSKLLLLGLLTVGGYFLGMVVYGACTPFAPYICNISDVCTETTGCDCFGVTISSGESCSLSGDSEKTILTGYGIGCSDIDGCICPDGTDLIGPSCVAPNVVAPVISSLGSPTILNNNSTFSFHSDKDGSVFYIGSCGIGSLSNATIGDNTTTFILANNYYNNCKLYIQDSLQAISNILIIPSFTINYTAPASGGGGGGTATCYDSNLVCTNGVYVIKEGGYYCAGGNLGKDCSVSSNSDTELSSILSDLDLTKTGFTLLLDSVKEEKSILYQYNPQSIKINIYVPKYKIYLIKKTILTLNRRLESAINKKLLKTIDPSYMIENYEDLTSDSKILVYKEIGSLVDTYNDFLGVLYMVLDMKQKDYLPLAKYYLETYFTQFANFNK